MRAVRALATAARRLLRRRPALLALLAASTLALGAPAVLAAPCAGFVDVDDASPFCPNVEWLKNRAVTLGCTVPASYCPNDPVIRLSMAAFMNRLGIAMTPAIVYADGTGGTLDIDVAPTLCPMALGVASYPRAVQLVAVVSAQALAAATALDVVLVQSTNGGASWSALHLIPSSVAGSDTWLNAQVVKGEIPLDAGVAYQLGVRVSRSAGGSVGDPAVYVCQIKGVIASRTGTTSPFDTAP